MSMITPILASKALVSLGIIDILVIAVYFIFVLGIGFYLKRFTKTGDDFFMAGRDMTAWIAGLSFLSANLGSLELMGWAASAYQYGILASHWYLIGAVPGMLLLALVMMPFYYICKTHSVPGYLDQRYGADSRALSAISFAVMTILMSGVNMYAMAIVMQTVLGWDIHFSIWVSSLTVAAYVVLGGLLSAIFNEVLQFMLIWLGALLIPVLGLYEAGGWTKMVDTIHRKIAVDGFRPDLYVPGTGAIEPSFTSLWSSMGSFQDNPMGIHWVAIVFGLGAILAPGYWTSDFLVVQRVLTAKDLRSAKLAPIIGAAFKMLVPFIVILPGMLGMAVLKDKLWPDNVAKPAIAIAKLERQGNTADASAALAKIEATDKDQHRLVKAAVAEALLKPEDQADTAVSDFNQVLPLMLGRYLGPGLLGLGITALIAGFMSGMAGNISAFATVWTYDIYRPIKPNGTDAHYVSVGRWCTILGVLISIGTAYVCMRFESIMTYVQALFSFFIAPLFGTVLIGMLWARATKAGGFWGLLAGTGSSVLMFLWVHFQPSALKYIALSEHAKPMAENMFRALWCGLIGIVVTVTISLLTQPKPRKELTGLVMSCTEIPGEGDFPVWQRPVFWGAVVFVAFVAINIIFW